MIQLHRRKRRRCNQKGTAHFMQRRIDATDGADEGAAPEDRTRSLGTHCSHNQRYARMRCPTLLHLLTALATFNALATAGPIPDAATIVAKATERLEGVTSYKATIDTKSTAAPAKHWKYLEIWRRMPNGRLFYRLERFLPPPQPFGPYLYLRNPAGTWEVWTNRAYKLDFESATPYREALPLPDNMKPLVRLSDAKFNGHTSCYLIRQTLRKPDPDIAATVRAKVHVKYKEYYIAKSSYLVRAIKWVDENGALVKSSVATQLEYNVPIADSEFAVPANLPRTNMQTRAEYVRTWRGTGSAPHRIPMVISLLAGIMGLVLLAGIKLIDRGRPNVIAPRR